MFEMYGSRTRIEKSSPSYSVYVKQIEYAEKEGYIGRDALFEMYVTDPTKVKSEDEIITEIYYPVKKIGKNNK